MGRAADIRAYRALDRTCPYCWKSPAFRPCDSAADDGPCASCLRAELAPKAGAFCDSCHGYFMLGLSHPRRAVLRGKRPSTTIQSLIFDSAQFTIRQAKSWARKHGFSWRVPDVTAKSVRLRQAEPDLFRRSSFRTITLTDGVKAVIGRSK